MKYKFILVFNSSNAGELKTALDFVWKFKIRVACYSLDKCFELKMCTLFYWKSCRKFAE